jgi:hypothetical protein
MRLLGLALLILATQGGCAAGWTDRYDPADVSHRTTRELCRSGGADQEQFERCMDELLPPSGY